MISTVALSLLSLCLLVALLYRERTNGAERQKLLDRIQAPEASQMAAIDSVIAARPAKPPVEDWVPLPLIDSDLQLADYLDPGVN